MPDPRPAHLSDYLASTNHSITHYEFWAEWDRIAGVLVDLVWSDDAAPELREAFTDLLASPDDAGWAVPDGQTQQ
ncbi:MULTISPECIES: hypothetical protein [Xanthomonas]|jgi:hypothetical protein|uniref:hypothetical protein n=1 Tax=Xanthomonas TaxID=338 RepID=UPI00029C9394|nr:MULTISPECIES: hypothetical protein [Xanthomonas]EKU25260.1 hypothetical protein XTG29_01789 [Xanthomonas translucens pv. graminis ART-Xtg29]MCE4363516.1 hypothetical protein [Xanthomonas hortorum]QUI81099.1 hypothetical protein ICA18_01885 [Xanthomonas arboricola pv. corylina]UKE54822.1 hypothetical protein KFS84_02585 [Xanthomonas translucens pv. graminis]WDK83481.1 hypothetical protein JH311_01705 [Xanthomonas campestris pv. campestris]